MGPIWGSMQQGFDKYLKNRPEFAGIGEAMQKFKKPQSRPYSSGAPNPMMPGSSPSPMGSGMGTGVNRAQIVKPPTMSAALSKMRQPRMAPGMPPPGMGQLGIVQPPPMQDTQMPQMGDSAGMPGMGNIGGNMGGMWGAYSGLLGKRPIPNPNLMY